MNLEESDQNLNVTETMVLVLVGIVAILLVLGAYFAKDYKGDMSYIFLNTDKGVVPCKQYGEDTLVECDLAYLNENR